MSEQKTTPTSTPAAGHGDAAAAPQTREKESGRVAFDARGNPVWEWRVGDGQFARDASTSLVRKLEAPHLSLEATAIVRKQDGKPPPAKAQYPAGFNPYDSGAAPSGYSRPASQAVPVRQPARPAASPSQGEPGLMHKLRSWMRGGES